MKKNLTKTKVRLLNRLFILVGVFGTEMASAFDSDSVNTEQMINELNSVQELCESIKMLLNGKNIDEIPEDWRWFNND